VTPTSGAIAARNAVYLSFALNGLCFATLASRYPDLRGSLGLSNGSLGLLLLAIAVGSVLGMPTSGHLIERFGADGVVRMGAWTMVGSMVAAGIGATTGVVPLVALGLFGYGIGTGTWDVAMNVEGAGVERLLGQSIMPRFHAAWSVGTFTGAGLGAVAAALDVPIAVHYATVPILAASVLHFRTRAYASISDEPAAESPHSRSAWLEPRTLAIGAMVLAFTLAEGSANDWLALGLVDGYHAPHWVGVLGFALFVAAMTTGRFLGPIVLDRFGRLRSLLGSALAATVGVLLVVWSGAAVVAVVGILLWGFGSALGFPVGMSAAADDPLRAARRVSVVSTLGYGAFLGGPPLVGFVGNHVGTLDSLLVVAVAMVPAAVLVLAVRRPRPVSAGTG
jgi:MFS family permease